MWSIRLNYAVYVQLENEKKELGSTSNPFMLQK